jgi:hypothetical protein
MTDADAAVQDALCAAYREEAGCYGEMLRLLEGLPDFFRDGQGGDDRLRQAVTVLEKVQAIEAGVGATKQQWDSSRRKPGPALSTALKSLGEVLAKLLHVVGQAEQAATAQQGRLAPELDVLVRVRQMQRAYGKR